MNVRRSLSVMLSVVVMSHLGVEAQVGLQMHRPQPPSAPASMAPGSMVRFGPALASMLPHSPAQAGRYVLHEEVPGRGHRAAAPERDIYKRMDEVSGPRLWRRAVLASATLAATSALVARWSSNRGDEAYDRYLSSAGEKRREDAFDEAERYDRIAGAAFLAMEAGLVLTAYFVFF